MYSVYTWSNNPERNSEPDLIGEPSGRVKCAKENERLYKAIADLPLASFLTVLKANPLGNLLFQTMWNSEVKGHDYDVKGQI